MIKLIFFNFTLANFMVHVNKTETIHANALKTFLSSSIQSAEKEVHKPLRHANIVLNTCVFLYNSTGH